MADEIPKKDGFGFNKGDRILAERREVREGKKPVTLNPSFPWGMAPMPFNEMRVVPSHLLELTQPQK